MKKIRWGIVFFGVVMSMFCATTMADIGDVYSAVPGDLSVKYLNMLFGNVGGSLNQSFSGQTVGHLFYIFNQGILIACGIWVLIALASLIGKLVDGDVQSVSKQGKTFLSICLGVILIVPSPTTGYSTVQNIIMKVVVQGTKLANGIWDYTVNQWALSAPVFVPPQRINNTTDPDTGFANNKNDYMRVLNDLWSSGRASSGPLKDIIAAEVCYYDSLRSAQNDNGGLFDQNNTDYEQLVTYNSGTTPSLVFGYNCGSISFHTAIKGDTRSPEMLAPAFMTSINQLANISKSLSCEIAGPMGKKSSLCQGFNTTYNQSNYDTLHELASNTTITAMSTLMTSLINVNEYITNQIADNTKQDNCKLNGVSLNKQECMQEVIKPQLKSGGWINAGAFYWLLAHGQGSEPANTVDKSTLVSNSLDRIFIDKQVIVNGIDPAKNELLTPVLVDITTKMRTELENSSDNSGASTNPVNQDSVITEAQSMASQWKNLICNGPMLGYVCGDKDPASQSHPTQSNNTAIIETGAFSATVDFLNASLYNMVALVSNLTSQLNDPNIDPQLVLMQSGLQMIITAAAQYQNYIILVLSVSVMLIMLAVGGASGVCSFLCDSQAILLSAFMKSIGGLFKKLAFSMLLMGVMMAFYIPLYPWIVFTFAVIGWFIAVIQAMAAGPLICLGLTNPHGQDLSSTLRQSIMLLLSIFIRPALMVISLVIAMILSRILFYYMLQGLSIIMNTMFATNISDIAASINNGSTNGDISSTNTQLNQQNLWHSLIALQTNSINTTNNMLNSSSMIVPQMLGNGNITTLSSPYIKFIIQFVSTPMILALVSYMTYKIITHSYSLIFTIPTYVMKWIGGEAAGESGSLQQDANASKDAAQKGAKAGGSGLSQTTKARDSMQSAGVKSTSTLASGAFGLATGMFGGNKNSNDDDDD